MSAVIAMAIVVAPLASSPPPARAEDTTAPTAPSITGAAFTGRHTLSPLFRVSWSASDETGVASYDVRYRRAKWHFSKYGVFVAWKNGVTGTTSLFRGSAGYTYCFSVRARDAAGNVSAYGPERCAGIPVNNTQMAASSGWKRFNRPGHYFRTYSLATRAGTTLRTPVRAMSITLLATRCPSCGTVDVLLGSTRLKRVSLASSTTRKRSLIPIVTSSTSPRTGMLTIRTVTNGKPVMIEGIGARPDALINVTGRVLFDDGTPVAGASVTGTATKFTTSLSAARARIQATAAGTGIAATDSDTTGADGTYSMRVGPEVLSARVLVEVSFTPEGGPEMTMAKWVTTTTTSAAAADIVLPSLAGTEVTLTDGAGATEDGTMAVQGLPEEVATLNAKAYDPSETPEAFPGEFEESGAIPLNSAGFSWLEARDADGNPVESFTDPITIRQQLARSQWPDLVDLHVDTDRIEIPIYTYDETTDIWNQEQDGWLEDVNGAILSEDVQDMILDGTYEGELVAAFRVNHLSYMNVDYAFVGLWRLDRIARDLRNNSCFFDALRLSTRIVHSAAGRAAFGELGLTADQLSTLLAEGMGPNVIVANLIDKYGAFNGNEADDLDDQVWLNALLWNGCGDGSTAVERRNTTVMMTVTLIHLLAHYLWDVMGAGNWIHAEPSGDVGNFIESHLFGGLVQTDGVGSANQITLDGEPVPFVWTGIFVNHDTWSSAQGLSGGKARAQNAEESPLGITIATESTTFDLGAEIPVTVTYQNNAGVPIPVYGENQLEGHPLWFEIVREGETDRVPFRGVRAKRFVDEDEFVILAPGEQATRSFTLLMDELGNLHYNMLRSGTYSVRALYTDVFGLPITASNALSLTIGAGAQILGTVSDAASGDGIPGATITVRRGGAQVTTATTNDGGSYSIPELPGADYELEVRARGYARSTRTVSVANGATATANFSLSALLGAGDLRLVLTWGAEPRDLDSHLWLPPETPYHVYYGRRGSADSCPFATLDQDVTSGFGPETITITQPFEGTYRYAIYHYSGSGSIPVSGARVEVYDSRGLIATIQPPADGAGTRWWHVLDYNGSTGAITEVNQMVSDASAYSDSTAGCPSAPSAAARGSEGKPGGKPAA